MRSSLAALLCCTIGLCISVIALSKDLDAKPEYYFWNEVTGETQWDDPGDVPYQMEDGRRYWLTPEGEKTDVDPTAHRYVWVEQWSGEHQRSYFYNQETGQSTWEKPADMAWRRIRAKHDEL